MTGAAQPGATPARPAPPRAPRVPGTAATGRSRPTDSATPAGGPRHRPRPRRPGDTRPRRWPPTAAPAPRAAHRRRPRGLGGAPHRSMPGRPARDGPGRPQHGAPTVMPPRPVRRDRPATGGRSGAARWPPARPRRRCTRRRHRRHPAGAADRPVQRAAARPPGARARPLLPPRRHAAPRRPQPRGTARPASRVLPAGRHAVLVRPAAGAGIAGRGPVRGARCARARRPRLDLPRRRPQRRRPLGGAQGRPRRERPGRAGRGARRAPVPRPAQPPQHRRDPQLRPARRRRRAGNARRLHRHGLHRRVDARAGPRRPRGRRRPARRPRPHLHDQGAARAGLPARRGARLQRLQARQRHAVRAPPHADRHGGRGADRRRRRRRLRHRRLPRPEVVRAELSPASDLYTVGRTLAVLALGIEPARGGVATELPDDHPLLLRHESLHRLLLRATHPDPRYRFGSADEMAEQLDGVRREVLAVDEQRPRPAPSGGLLRAARHVRPGPAAPRRRVRPRPARGRPDRRPAARTARRRGRGDAGPDDWRHRWSAALAALAGGDLDTARAAFDALYSTFPGELAPKLALAAVAECAGGRRQSRSATTSWSPPSTRAGPTRPSGSPAPGCAPGGGPTRCPRCSPCPPVPAATSPPGARPSRPPCSATTPGRPTTTSCARPRRCWSSSTWTRWPPQRMRVAVLDAAVERVGGGSGEPVLGCAWEERALRLELERSLRALARLTPDRAEKITLVDRANSAHPRTLR